MMRVSFVKFYIGDIVIKDHKGYHYFVDREKNIIRRSGENISSAEVEKSLLSLKYIINCAVVAKNHEIYEEEVFAFVIVKKGVKQDPTTAKNILKEIKTELAYFDGVQTMKPPYFTFSHQTMRNARNKMKVLKNEEDNSWLTSFDNEESRGREIYR